MGNNILLPKSIVSINEFKRKFNLWELYRAFVFVPGALVKLIGNNKSKLVDKQFIERIQLAITEVNGCAACSYQNTKMALQQGMSKEEICSFLVGDGKYIRPDEAKAIMFAQHFADSKGIPGKYAYDSIVNEYGRKKASVILSAAQLILAGNIYGIPYSAFRSRLRGRPYKDSSLLYELGIELTGLILLPLATLHGLLSLGLGFPNIRFNKSTQNRRYTGIQSQNID